LKRIRATAIDPYLAEAYYNISVVFRRIGKAKEEKTAYDEANRIKPELDTK